jgi:hypothetical protein
MVPLGSVLVVRADRFTVPLKLVTTALPLSTAVTVTGNAAFITCGEGTVLKLK